MYLVKGIKDFFVYTGKKFFSNNISFEYKFLILGDDQVGKTSFINKSVNDIFDLEIESTSENKAYNMELKLGYNKISIILVDVATSQLSKNHGYIYHNINGAFILYDITKHETFEKVQTYIVDIIGNIGNNIPIILIGNKNDLKNLREVHENELKELALQFNCDHSEITCTDENSALDIIKFMVFKAYYNSLSDENKEEILKMLWNKGFWIINIYINRFNIKFS